MPNIRVREETLRALRRVRAVMSLTDDEEHSYDDALQMVLSFYFEKVTLRTPVEVRGYAHLLEEAEKELKAAK